MAISSNKTRRSYSIDTELLSYLEKRAEEESKERGKKVYVSNIVEELAKNDKKIRETFG